MTKPFGLPSQLLSSRFGFFAGRFQSCRFICQFVFRTCWEVLNVVLQIEWARQRLPCDVHLASSIGNDTEDACRDDQTGSKIWFLAIQHF
jgi:hypothetical protein